jgi:hypothetical protein
VNATSSDIHLIKANAPIIETRALNDSDKVDEAVANFMQQKVSNSFLALALI